MPEKIFKAVAYPSTLLFAPQIPALINMSVQGLLMIYGWAFFQFSPLIFIITIVLGHIFIASQAAREPHLQTVLQAWAKSKIGTKNLHKSKTRKFIP